MHLTTNPCAPAQGGNQNMVAEESANGLKMYPNPNRGDQLLISLDGIEQGVSTVSIDIYDAFGKRAIARTIPVNDEGYINSMLDLNGSLAAGLYTVSITAGERQFNERLVIQP
ncbi:MAG: T9SS type A sorting domain-containing protein [Flavobacteriales bacterium]|nr:T9SS type A sorting domain-containing protein [Flavobacteriales bacterium]